MAGNELSPSEVARRVGTTTRTVQRWIASGSLPARRVGGRWRVAFDALDAFTARTDGDGGSSGAPGAGDNDARAAGAVVPIRSLFVANRGEIARRIARTCERIGMRVTVPVVVGPDALDLLDIAAVVAAARTADADAVHPGFGFLAENVEFAEAVQRAGLRWVGPPASAIRSMGDKAAARRLAHSLGIPVVPGYDGDDQSIGALTAAATAIGFPILVKPAAGGGGKGMRVVRDPADLADSCASARREATAAFGDDRLVLERLVEGPRHIEVQVLFDAHGAGVHLGERDCSLQRRHQKVLEESPSPAVDPDLRTELGASALRLAGAVAYEGAGTCEFLVTDRGEHFFLEMNTRLQVEHPVTELVTGRDLVEDQLRIAAGEPLGFTQEAADAARTSGGHAVEVRLYAEDAEDGFLPAIGRIERLRWPTGDGIRVDVGIDEGEGVSGRFDPMLAKIIAHGADRGQALDRLKAALDATVVLGLTTNLRFLRWLVREPVVRAGQARIDTLDRIWPPATWAERTKVPDAAWTAAAAGLAIDGWRLNAPPRVRLAADDGTERAVELGAADPDGVPDGAPAAAFTPRHSAASTPRHSVAVAGAGPDRIAHVDVDGRSVAIRVAPPPDVDRAARAAVTHHVGGAVEVLAPMPGNVLAVHVVAGQTVAAGDPVATLEAMKMEHVVTAGIGGMIAEVLVRRADQVVRGQTLAIVEP
ncbi:MAG: biotin carboxylase N-terminal domain-containing protein [Chloroflexota bacterium]